MVSWKELSSKQEKFIQKATNIIVPYQQAWERFFFPTQSFLSKSYLFLTGGVSALIDCLALFILQTTKAIYFLVGKGDGVFKHIRRKLYVRKILSARKQWYANKAGNFYNPKIKATIYPSWECTWNISRSTDHYSGYGSKKEAQEVAFKMWMKMRLLEKRLETSLPDPKISISLAQKVLSNKIHIRPSTLGDIPHLLALMEQLGYPQTSESLKERLETYSPYSYASNHQTLVASRGKKIVGFIAFVFYDLFISEGKRCRIEGLVVDNQERDLSVKRKLVQAVEAFARDNDGKVIDLTADSRPINDNAYDFYRFLGYGNEDSGAKIYLKKEL